MSGKNAMGDYGATSAPTAPPMEMPQPTELYPRENLTLQQGTVPNEQHQLPPPSYQEAVHYPPAPPYPSYQPNIFPSASGPAPAQHIYPPANARPHSTTEVYVTPAPQPSVIHVVSSSGGNACHGRPCSYCPSGVVQRETDFCCLLCLIFLAVFTFPFGLLLLCCIPCTVRKRCTVCRRLYE